MAKDPSSLYGPNLTGTAMGLKIKEHAQERTGQTVIKRASSAGGLEAGDEVQVFLFFW
jgi:hypothetical protein